MTLSIGFDARYIRTDHHDGISRFSARLAFELAKLVTARDDLALTFLINSEAQAVFLPEGASTHVISAPTSPAEPLIARTVNEFGLDIVFSPMQTMGSRGRRYKLVLTVHDLIYYRHPMPPRQFNFALRALWRLYHLSWWPQRWLLNGADAIVSVSRTTAALIADNHLTRRPVYVVSNAADVPALSPNVGDERSRSIVYMGSFMPYKNVETLIASLDDLPGYELHLLSRIHPKDRARLSQLTGSRNVVFHDGVSDALYAELVSRAQALVTASLDEGFGIPVIEAMALGTPVVCSDIAIFREIGGDAAIFVDAMDARGFASAITSLEDPTVFAQRRQAGLRQAETFSWEASAKALLDVLVKVGAEPIR